MNNQKQSSTKPTLVAIKVDHTPPLTSESYFNMEDSKHTARFSIEETKPGGDIRLTILKRPGYSIIIPRNHCLSIVYKEQEETTAASAGDAKQV